MTAGYDRRLAAAGRALWDRYGYSLPEPPEAMAAVVLAAIDEVTE